MTTFFVTRHQGALEWARGRGLSVEHVVQFTPDMAAPGDIVMGTLPISVVADLCAKDVRYFHLSMGIPRSHRGRELTAQDMDAFGAELVEYTARRVENGD